VISVTTGGAPGLDSIAKRVVTPNGWVSFGLQEGNNGEHTNSRGSADTNYHTSIVEEIAMTPKPAQYDTVYHRQ